MSLKTTRSSEKSLDVAPVEWTKRSKFRNDWPALLVELSSKRHCFV